MTEALIALLVGTVVGVLVVLLLVRAAVTSQARAESELWRTQERHSIGRDALERSRPELRRRIGEEIARWTHSFPFRQEDSRFVGHPIDYIVFEGTASCAPGESTRSPP